MNRYLTFSLAIAMTLSTLAILLRAGVPPRAVRLTVRELLVARIERGPLGAREVSEVVEATVRVDVAGDALRVEPMA